MALLTGTPLGSLIQQEDIYLDGASTIFIQDYNATPLHNPDSDGFYYNLSGTTAYPVYELGCISNVVVSESREINGIQCDTVGHKGDIQQRNYISLSFELLTQFPLSTVRAMLHLGAVTASGGFEKVGAGQINNTQYWHGYTVKVYDESTGDYLIRQYHKCQFVGEPSEAQNYGESWRITGLELRAYADTTKPAAQVFYTAVRRDPSALV